VSAEERPATEPSLDPPESDNPWEWITFLEKLPQENRFVHDDDLVKRIRVRPLGEQDALLTACKERLGWRVGTMRERLRAIEKEAAPSFIERAYYITPTYLAEMIYRPEGAPKFGFLVHKFDAPDASPVFYDTVGTPQVTVKPIVMPLVEQRTVMLPSTYEEYGTDDELFAEIHALVTKYVVLDPTFAILTAAWVFYTWVADKFSVAVYLRVFGELGTAKTTFEEIVGHLAYRGILAAGSTTASPVFRLLDQLGGTLVVDEADHARNHTEWSDILKLLNTGTKKSHAVLRSESAHHEPFDVKGYSCFGPKMIASREPLRDAAFESRCLSSTMHWQPMSALKGVPLFLDDHFYEAAQKLRNKLLLWRFRNYLRVTADPRARLDNVEEARVTVNGLLVLAAISDPAVRARIVPELVRYSQQLRASRGNDTTAGAVAQALALAWVRARCPVRVLVKTVTDIVRETLPTTNGRRVGALLQGTLGLTTGKAGGDSYVLELTRSVLDRVALAYNIDLEALAQQHFAVLPPASLQREPVR
jgi:hypothetical protein